jgi:ribonuclease P protein component
VFTDGTRAHSDGVTVWVLPQPEQPDARLGLAVGTGAGGAVVRNRMRRRLRALVRSAPLTGVDLVVRADREATQLTYQELEVHLGRAITSAHRGRA